MNRGFVNCYINMGNVAKNHITTKKKSTSKKLHQQKTKKTNYIRKSKIKINKTKKKIYIYDMIYMA